ncbi:hypothetical protein PHMEG_0007845 [Phytophthora megakarya]|uniref:Bzip transcription factor n=1 Tax=Phytophthora megakarya TaxID=4795 RepID=A0A225WK60_9STRA|nr:hypothetical protein PHMEG_0007845 [Phytophthora megakarya]
MLKAVPVVSKAYSSSCDNLVSSTKWTDLWTNPLTKSVITNSNHTGTKPQQASVSSKVDNVEERQKQVLASILQKAPDLLVDISRSYARQREGRRRNQQRYRKKFDINIAALEQDVLWLHQQVRQHELEYQLLVSHPPTFVTPWNVISEYYRLFRDGYKGSKTPNSTSKPSTCKQGDAQMDFLHKVMAPNVSINSGFGVEALIEEWLAVQQIHRDITVCLFRLDYDQDTAIVAAIKSYALITEEMLLFAFPYFSDRSKDPKKTALMTKLVGQQIVISSLVRFEWDRETCQILSMHYSFDMVTPFLKLIGNIEDTARVLDGSLLSITTSS